MKRLFQNFKAFTVISTVQYSLMITAAIISSFAGPDSSSVPHHRVYMYAVLMLRSKTTSFHDNFVVQYVS
jgi:hypothetical protein